MDRAAAAIAAPCSHDADRTPRIASGTVGHGGPVALMTGPRLNPTGTDPRDRERIDSK
jgi:hypothetical protein